MDKDKVIQFRKSFPALKLIFGGNEQALVLVDLLESFAYRCSEEWVDKHGYEGITDDGFFAKSRALIMQDTGVLTASVKTAIDGLIKEGFILATSERYFQQYSKKIIHYKVQLETLPYLQKAEEYLHKPHRGNDWEAVRRILLPFMHKLTFFDNIIEPLGLGNSSWRKHWKEKRMVYKGL